MKPDPRYLTGISIDTHDFSARPDAAQLREHRPWIDNVGRPHTSFIDKSAGDATLDVRAHNSGSRIYSEGLRLVRAGDVESRERIRVIRCAGERRRTRSIDDAAGRRDGILRAGGEGKECG